MIRLSKSYIFFVKEFHADKNKENISKHIELGPLLTLHYTLIVKNGSLTRGVIFNANSFYKLQYPNTITAELKRDSLFFVN